MEKRTCVTTFRISEIPISLSKVELLEIVESKLSSGNSRDLVTVSSSLAPSPVDQDRFQVATITFESIPPQLVPCVGVRAHVLFKIDATTQVSFDTHFLGLTPLNDGIRNYDVEYMASSTTLSVTCLHLR